MTKKMYEKKMDGHICKVIRDKFLYKVLDEALKIIVNESYKEVKVEIQLKLEKEALEEEKKKMRKER